MPALIQTDSDITQLNKGFTTPYNVETFAEANNVIRQES